MTDQKPDQPPTRSPLRGLWFAVIVLLIFPATRAQIGAAAAIVLAVVGGALLTMFVLSAAGSRR